MRDIRIKGALYMRRIPLLTTPWFGIRLHGIVSPDARQPLHNHPFRWWFAIVLSGGYVEIRWEPSSGYCGGTRDDESEWRVYRSWWRCLFDRRWLWWNAMKGPATFHRIESVRPRTWTLFVHGRRIARWGFMADYGYVDADDFRDKEDGHE